MGKVWQGRMVLAIASVLPLLLTGCDGFFVPVTGGSGSSGAGDYVYVANANPSVASIAAFSVSSAGAATALTGSPYSLTFIPTALAITPQNGYLYVGGTTGIFAYAIDSKGGLTLQSNAGASVPVASMAITPDGKYLFALQSNVIVGTTVTPTAYSITIDEYQITSGGALVLAGTTGFATTTGTFTPKSVRVSPQGDFLALALGSAGTVVYQLNADIPSTTANVLAESSLSADNDVVFDSTSSTLYIARSGTSTGLGAYAVSSSGALTRIGSSLAATGSQPSALMLDPTGKFAYVLNEGSGSISAFTLKAGSVPTEISGSPFLTGTQPISLVADNTGKFLMEANAGGTPDMQIWAFNASGTGALSSTNSVPTGTDPTLPIAIAATH